MNHMNNDLDSFQKLCLASVLKVLCIFILAAFSASKPEILEAIKLVRKESESVEVFEEEPKKANSGLEETKYNNSNSFKELIEDIKAFNLSERIIQTLDFSKIINLLMVLMSKTIIKEDYETDDKHILDSAIEL